MAKHAKQIAQLGVVEYKIQCRTEIMPISQRCLNNKNPTPPVSSLVVYTVVNLSTGIYFLAAAAVLFPWASELRGTSPAQKHQFV